MSLGVVIKGSEGVVLAADSRVTLQAAASGQPPLIVNFDNATKLLSLAGSDHHRHVAAVTYGAALIGKRTAHSYLPEFELDLPKQRLSVSDYSERLGAFFLKLWKANMEGYKGPGMTFVVGGYDPDAPYGRVFLVVVPDQVTPVEQSAGASEFGMTWGGQLEFASRIINGFDPSIPVLLKDHVKDADKVFSSLLPHVAWKVPWDVLPLQDCIDLATFLVSATATAQTLSIGIRGVGGFIDVAVITRTAGFVPIRRKDLAARLEEGGK